MIRLKYLFLFITILLFLLIFFIVKNKINEKQYLLIKESTEVIEKPDWLDQKGNKVLFILKKGDKVTVKKVIYTKDFKFYKIKTEEGYEGFIIHDNTFEVISHGS